MNCSEVIRNSIITDMKDSFANPLDLKDLSWAKVVGSASSDGVYLKTDVIIDDMRYYLKLSNYDSYRGIFGHESVNELIASRLG